MYLFVQQDLNSELDANTLGGAVITPRGELEGGIGSLRVFGV